MKTAMQELIFHIAYMERRKYQDEQTTLLGGMNDCIMYDAIVIQNRVINELTKQYCEYLEKEKEQSINLIKQTCMFMGASIIDIEISKMEFEDIYNNYYNQKQHIIDIMKADENDGLYNQNK
jgi:hypothetical protein